MARLFWTRCHPDVEIGRLSKDICPSSLYPTLTLKIGSIVSLSLSPPKMRLLLKDIARWSRTACPSTDGPSGSSRTWPAVTVRATTAAPLLGPKRKKRSLIRSEKGAQVDMCHISENQLSKSSDISGHSFKIQRLPGIIWGFMQFQQLPWTFRRIISLT